MSKRIETTTPTVWALLGRRAGDNAQILALAEGLGCTVERKQLRFNRLSALPNMLLGASRLSIASDSRSLLQPPWPDAVVTAGRRSVPAARWVRERSGGATRLIHIGRPWGPTSWFDLIVTTPQYGLAAAPNVVRNLMPLYRPPVPDPSDLDRWAARFVNLPRPWIAVLVGGTSRPHLLDAAAARKLAKAADAAAREAGGSLLATFGPRAVPEVAEAFRSAIAGPAYIHLKQPQDVGTENPYRAYLHLADRFIVTSDSASMVAEAARSGKRVDVFPIPKRGDWRVALGRRALKRSGGQGVLASVCRVLLDSGFVTSVRDLDRYHEELRRAGMLEPGDAAARRQAEELSRAAARVRALVESPCREAAR
jgi:mitochondrial fission protein ELM1